MVTQLGALPERGRVVPEFGDAMLRECVVRPYRVITRLGDSQVEVLAVVHARRLVEGADE